MIDQTILFLTHSDFCDDIYTPYSKELGLVLNFDNDMHFGQPLKKIFSNVIRFDISVAYCQFGVIRTNQMIIDLVRQHNPKYVFWPTMTYEVFEETFQKIRKSGVFVIGWFFDDETRFDNYSRWWIPYLDYIFTADKMSVSKYQQFGAKAYHLLVTGEAEDYKSQISETSYEVSFVGSKYVADRDSLVNRFYNDGVSISTFGNGWPNGFVSHDEMVQIFGNSKINICFTKSNIDQRNQLKGKIFDITLSGGFLLCEYVDGIEAIFELGIEIVCFNNYADAIKKIDYFLRNNDERKKIAIAGKKKSIRNLTQHKLLENAFLSIEADIIKTKRNIIIQTVSKQMPIHIRRVHADYHYKRANVLKKYKFYKKISIDEYYIAFKYSAFIFLKRVIRRCLVYFFILKR